MSPVLRIPGSRGRDPLPPGVHVLVGAAFVIALGYGLISPVLPQFARGFDVGIAAATAVVSAFAVARLAFAPVGGGLVDRLGERPVYLTGLLIVAASTAAAALAQNYWQLLVFRGIGGVGSTMFTVSSMGLLVRLAPPARRGRISGMYSSAFLLGGVAGPALGGALGTFGMRVPFVVYAVALVVATLLVATRLESGRRAVAVDTGESAGPEQAPLSFTEAMRDPAYRAAVVTSFATGWANFGVRIALVPLFAVAVAGDEPATAGLVLALYAMGNAVVLQFSGRLADAIGRKPPVLAGLIVSGTATIVLGFTTSVAALCVASVVAGAGSGLLAPAQQATVADVVGDRRGARVIAAFQMFSDAGSVLGPVLAGIIADRFGYVWAFGVTGMISLLAAITWLPTRETGPVRRRIGRQ